MGSVIGCDDRFWGPLQKISVFVFGLCHRRYIAVPYLLVCGLSINLNFPYPGQCHTLFAENEWCCSVWYFFLSLISKSVSISSSGKALRCQLLRVKHKSAKIRYALQCCVLLQARKDSPIPSRPVPSLVSSQVVRRRVYFSA